MLRSLTTRMQWRYAASTAHCINPYSYIAASVLLVAFPWACQRQAPVANAHAVGETSSKVWLIERAAENAVAAKGRAPESFAEVQSWIESSLADECPYDDCMVDGYGTPFKLQLTHLSGQLTLIVTSAGHDRIFGSEDQTSTTTLSVSSTGPAAALPVND